MYYIKQMHSLYRPSSRGFTLIEVLVALVIFGLGVALLTGTISDSLLRAGQIYSDERAAVLADAILARLGEDVPLRVGDSRGEVSGLVWRVVVTPQLGTEASIPLDIVDLTIAAQSGQTLGEWHTLRIAAAASLR